jgi:hypothetical protein
MDFGPVIDYSDYCRPAGFSDFWAYPVSICTEEKLTIELRISRSQ